MIKEEIEISLKSRVPELTPGKKLIFFGNSPEQILQMAERYCFFAEKTGRMFVDADLEKREIYWAGAIRDVTGYDNEEFKKIYLEDFKEFLHTEDRKRISRIIDYSLETGEGINEEYRLRRKDGSYVHLENSVIFLKRERGRPYRALGIFIDMTEKVLSRQKLKRIEEKFLYIAEQTGQLIFDIDTMTNQVEWAGAIEEITGFTPEELSGFDLPSLMNRIHPEEIDNVWGSLEYSLKTGNKFYQEFWVRKKSGNYMYVETSVVFLKGKEGQVYRALGVVKNITERLQSQEKLQKSEERFRTYMQNFKGVGFQLDRNFIPVMMQGAVEDILGYSPEEILCGNIQCIDLVHPEDRKEFLENQIKLVESPKMVINHEYRVLHREGTIRWVHEIIQSICDSEGKNQLFQGFIHDITDRKKAEEDLKKAEVIRKKEIHHRIKNNLQVISSLLDLQAEKFSDRRVVEAFRESQNRIISMSMIHEELYRSRDMENLDFTAYVQKLIAELFRSYKLESREISLLMDIEKDISLKVDTAIPMGIIINELVSNSLKHAFSEGTKGEIRIKLHRLRSHNPENPESSENSRLLLVISDNGSGFPENIDFENLNSLGLQLVNTLVEQIEGEIELKRKQGTEFRIEFGKEEN
ncbi:PAS domain S-box protein [Methanosarcina sp. KYL-1]|uniref:PAS domain-containing protein n=1 Tax=Methanosarcina sp. KYL-1 TaxID=2602068 RepID=UPI002100C8BD|nr:PAS domain-containing protein [Methanosarcina sp. KYL-1]MCQ1534902.1 PAS domain S-box protein [Methanosarcina sp. KYL-1]